VLKSAGSLVIMGGGKMTDGIRDRFLELAGGKKARLVVIPTASAGADQPEVSSSYVFWQGQNVASVNVLHTRDRHRADDPAFVEPLTHATGVWLGGGDQSKLAEAYLNTAVLRELYKLLDRGGVIGGTSAGASIMSSTMITGGSTKASLGTGRRSALHEPQSHGPAAGHPCRAPRHGWTRHRRADRCRVSRPEFEHCRQRERLGLPVADADAAGEHQTPQGRRAARSQQPVADTVCPDAWDAGQGSRDSLGRKSA